MQFSPTFHFHYIYSSESRGGGPGGLPPPQKCFRCSKLELFSKIYKIMSYDVEFSKFLFHILSNMVRSTAKSTYFKELLFPFFKIFYTLIVHYVINFAFSIGKQPYRDVINFLSYIHVVYSYNDINFTYLYMRTNYLRHLANIVDILWNRPVWGGGGQLPIELVNLL